MFTVLSSIIDGIIVNPGDIIGKGSCNGSIDKYLCNCLTSNVTIDIQMSPGYHNFSYQPSCTVWNKTSITITGSSSNDTVIKCINGFSINIFRTQSVIIRNLIMTGCGNAVITDDQTYIGQYVFYLDSIVNDISITNLYMSNTVGYSIIICNFFESSESIELTNIHITNTAVSDNCKDYKYNNESADFSCSGSGIFVVYNNLIDNSINASTIRIENCSFSSNINILPTVKYNEFLGIANTGYKGNNPIPLVGAAGISILYGQDTYNVSTEISNTQFNNNSGTFSASVALVVADSSKSTIVIENCTFNNSVGVYKSSGNDPTAGGIYFINLGRVSASPNAVGTKGKVLTVKRSNFMNLVGKLGVAFHIEKNSPDSILVIINIEQCNFTSNVADSGSVIFANDRSASLSYRPVLGGSLNINLVNINANHNLLSSTLENVTNNFITGIFHISNCLIKLTCSEHCRFQCNEPSVFYAHRTALTISGNISFMNNSAVHGGAMRLIDTVLYVSTNTTGHFMNNFAILNGGAIKIEFAMTNIQSQDNCPIQFVGLSPLQTIVDSNFTDIKSSMNIDVLFRNNFARDKTLESIFANVFYICSWYPDTSVLTRLGPNSEVNERGFRDAVYREAFNYKDAPIHSHLNISAIVPCVCNDTNDFRQHVTACLENQPINLPDSVIPGRPFVIKLTSLDTVGSVGYSSEIVSNAYNLTSGRTFALNESQASREFLVGDQLCIEVDFTIYVHTNNESLLNTTKGNLILSVAIPRFITIPFNFVEKCPTGFVLDGIDEQFACMCNKFLTEVSNEGFSLINILA